MNRIANTSKNLLKNGSAKVLLLVLSGAFLIALPSAVSAQKSFKKSYPASKNVRLDLVNRTGTVTVEGWERNEIRISASLERPYASIEPSSHSGQIRIDVVKANQGRGEVGDANFTIYVPYGATVDIETRIGNLNVSNVRGVYVRAHITSEGDVTLTNIVASKVTAKNVNGNMFFDGIVRPGGTYVFKSVTGDVNVRIPLESSFRLLATAPTTRNISLGSFSNTSMRLIGNGRRVVGKVGGGSATLTVENLRGTISFLRR
ncbi:MAG: hypothetical protein DWQ47_06700 [Acidobacteria bacterium]|mgnify:CR=1 FL=1|nr:MAG: hypothetical protein DWQ32_10250 [Acidobacteriota bacterium]REK02063.1 MAG: hypothetical protein DWQ38_06680 [Acidobacteriota bacterium]REK15021.1 MAG: hypothetical protein DWQ43_15940 [Acidobacteriota bacterium]REK45735.1 MAG: hypothetical protein DWQ47_06700 [Acidobacteriota bacterium]